LVRHLNEVGGPRVEVRERPGTYNAHETIIELENIRNLLSPFFTPERTAGQSPKQRRSKQRYDPVKDRALVDEWEGAKAYGIEKKDFAKDKKISLKDLERAQDRVRHR
jgi:hypothetical protein